MDSINQENAKQTQEMNEHSDPMENLSMTPVTHIFTEPSAPIISNEVPANLEVVETLHDMVDNMAEAHYESDEMVNMQRSQMTKRPAKRSASRGRSRSRASKIPTKSKSKTRSNAQKASPARAASKSKAKSRSTSSTRDASKSKPKPKSHSTSANRKSSRGRSNSRRRN